MKKNAYKKPKENPNVVGNIAIVFLSILLIAVGVVMLTTNLVKMIYFCYAGGGCLLVWGIWLISRYFLRNEFQETTNYGFSIGTLAVILGAIALIRSNDIVASIPNYLGVLVLVEGVVMLQNTVQLKNLNGLTWAFTLILSLVSCAASIVILLDVNKFISKKPQILYIILICVGAFALICLSFVGIRTRKFKKQSALEFNRNVEESDEWFEAQSRISDVKDDKETPATEFIEENDDEH